jgi:hypothetical protein
LFREVLDISSPETERDSLRRCPAVVFLNKGHPVALKEVNLKAALKRADLSKLQQPKREQQQEKARAQGLKKGPGPGFGRGL